MYACMCMLYIEHIFALLLQEMQGTVGTSSLCTVELESWVKSLVRISSLIKLCEKKLKTATEYMKLTFDMTILLYLLDKWALAVLSWLALAGPGVGAFHSNSQNSYMGTL